MRQKKVANILLKKNLQFHKSISPASFLYKNNFVTKSMTINQMSILLKYNIESLQYAYVKKKSL